MTNWTQKGATLSDKSACKEFGLSQPEIIQAINEEKLQYRQNYMHGNPYFRLLREEVENLVVEKYGADYLRRQKLQQELAQVKRQLRKLKKETAVLEKRKTELLAILGE
ncbi:MAG: hypothetical protein GY832_38085 [Chloroflexi bacterium]|nr:hypothetical protein [Chloroflexota bacterium]